VGGGGGGGGGGLVGVGGVGFKSWRLNKRGNTSALLYAIRRNNEKKMSDFSKKNLREKEGGKIRCPLKSKQVYSCQKRKSLSKSSFHQVGEGNKGGSFGTDFQK